MRDRREIRYYASIPKVALALIGSAALTAFGWQLLVSGDNGIGTWVVIGLFGLLTLGALTALVFAVVRRKPVLAINDIGITYFPPGRSPNVTVPWDDVAHIGIDTEQGARGIKSYYLAIQARHPDRYVSDYQRFMRVWYSAGRDVVIVVPLDMLFFWASRTRRAQMLERIKSAFAQEIIQYEIGMEDDGLHV